MSVMTKLFIVASVSSNTNEFGLRGMILVARDGEIWQVAANYLNVKAKGQMLLVPSRNKADKPYDANFSPFGFEIPQRLERDPVRVEEVWKTAKVS